MKQGILYVLSMLIIASILPSLGIAQSPTPVITPYGGSVEGTIDVPYKGCITWDNENIYFSEASLIYEQAIRPIHLFYIETQALDLKDPEDKIASVCYKRETGTIYVLTDNGALFAIDLQSKVITPKSWGGGANYESFKKIKGDALYMLSSQRFLVSRDNASTWLDDTSGLNKSVPQWFDLDTLQYVYIVNANGIFRQHPDSMTWIKLNSYTGPAPSGIYIDRLQRILVGCTAGKVYISNDRGSTWQIDTAGIGLTALTVFSDDAFGNLYGISSDKQELFRSLGGIQPWTRIDQPVTNGILDVNVHVSSTNPALISISGDTLLFLGTGFGTFISRDQGTTWQEKNYWINSKTTYGYLYTATGRTMVSTSLGIFYQNPGTAQWTKTYPQNGYYCYTTNAAGTLFRDASGILYSLGPRVNMYDAKAPVVIVKSTDDGLTWVVDTAGFSMLGRSWNPLYYVDLEGTQYYASYSIGSGTIKGLIYSKKQGQGWAIDTSGYPLGATSRSPMCIGTDRSGNVYLGTGNDPSGGGLLMSRPLAGGKWIPDTAGLSNDFVFALTCDKVGNVYAGGFVTGLMKKTGGVWRPVPMPYGFSGCWAYRFSVDSSNTLFASFADAASYRGVYFTTDGGNSWTNCGFEKVNIRSLVSYGDTTYVVTQVNGIYKLTRTSGTGVVVEIMPRLFILEQNYPNPFNPTTTISFELQGESMVKLTVYDLLGKEVGVLMNEKRSAGSQRYQFDGSRLASGVYFYRLEVSSLTSRGNKFIDVKKMILVK
jgi:hypothetical protein